MHNEWSRVYTLNEIAQKAYKGEEKTKYGEEDGFGNFGRGEVS